MNTTPPADSISWRQHRDLWRPVKHSIKLRNHGQSLAQGVNQFEGIFHRARMQEALTDIALYALRYHPGIHLPDLSLEAGPCYAEELLDAIAQHMHPQERDLLEQMLDLVYWMHDVRQFHQPTRHSDASSIVTWRLSQKLDDLTTYCDRRVLEKVRAAHTVQLHVSLETEAGRFLQARLPKDGEQGTLTLWGAPVGDWRFTGVSIGDLLIHMTFTPAFLQPVRHWTELHPHVHPAPCDEGGHLVS